MADTGNVSAVSQDGDHRRVYCNGQLSRDTLRAQLDAGYVCTDVVRKGQGGRNDVAYFRKGTDAEIAQCREMLAKSETATESLPSTDNPGDGKAGT